MHVQIHNNLEQPTLFPHTLDAFLALSLSVCGAFLQTTPPSPSSLAR